MSSSSPHPRCCLPRAAVRAPPRVGQCARSDALRADRQWANKGWIVLATDCWRCLLACPRQCQPHPHNKPRKRQYEGTGFHHARAKPVFAGSEWCAPAPLHPPLPIQVRRNVSRSSMTVRFLLVSGEPYNSPIAHLSLFKAKQIKTCVFCDVRLIGRRFDRSNCCSSAAVAFFCCCVK